MWGKYFLFYWKIKAHFSHLKCLKIECCFWKLGNSTQFPLLSGTNTTYLLIKEMS